MAREKANMKSVREAMDLFVALRVPGVTPAVFADLFERLVWLVDDNGEAIVDVLGDWLKGEDDFKVWVALGIEDVFLFRTKEEMLSSFADLCIHRPEVKSRCKEIIAEWDHSVREKIE